MLARAHARSGQPARLSGYLGVSGAFIAIGSIYWFYPSDGRIPNS